MMIRIFYLCTRPLHRAAIWLPLLLALVSPGCGPTGPETGRVKGVLLLDAKPMQSVLITFQPKQDGRSATAITDANGEFDLDWRPGKKACLVGQHEVFLTQLSAGEIDPNWPKPTKVPGRYQEPFELVEVKRGNNEFKFELSNNAPAR